MEHNELYEKLRVLLSFGSVIPFPKHKATHTLLSNLFNEEEAKIVVLGIKKVHTPVNLGEISNSFEICETDIREKLDDMADKGLIQKIAPEEYMALPYYPGILPNYSIFKKADLDSMRKVSEANSELMELSWIQEISAGDYGLFRVLPAIGPMEKTIKINESVEVENTILPHEIIKEHISNIEPQKFSVVPCACRDSSKLAGDPCKKTNENFCVFAGNAAEEITAKGFGREVSFDELMELFKRAEKEGLVHQTTNIQGSTTIICNCCPCCCIYISSYIETSSAGAEARSNFAPERNTDLCVLCEKCSRICPVEAIFHHYPHRKDATDDYMMVRSEICLGCGVCASNCPNDAITLKKVRDIEPAKDYVEMMGKYLEGRTH